MKLKLNADGSAVVKNGNPVYVHDDGREVEFDAPGTVATIARLNGEAKTNRERAEDVEKQLKAFEGIDDAAKAKKALEIVANLDQKQLIQAGEKDRAVSEAVKAVEDKYKPYVTKAETLEGRLHQHLVGDVFVKSEFLAKKFAVKGPAGVEVARSMFGKQFKVEEDGKVVAYDQNGAKLYSRSRPGELASPEEAIEQLVESHPYRGSLLIGDNASGSGTPPGGGNGAPGGKPKVTRSQFEAMPPAERMSHAKAGGLVVDG